MDTILFWSTRLNKKLWWLVCDRCEGEGKTWGNDESLGSYGAKLALFSRKTLIGNVRGNRRFTIGQVGASSSRNFLFACFLLPGCIGGWRMKARKGKGRSTVQTVQKETALTLFFVNRACRYFGFNSCWACSRRVHAKLKPFCLFPVEFASSTIKLLLLLLLIFEAWNAIAQRAQNE